MTFAINLGSSNAKAMTGRASNIVTCRMVGGFAAGLLTSVSAIAQTAPDAVAPVAVVSSDMGAQVFTPADFARFAPRSALDMVEKLPDFTLLTVSGDRGLGQASENILINGERISGKSNDARHMLDGEPASFAVLNRS